MNQNKLYLPLLAAILFILGSCDDFFDTKPYDELSPATFWKTESDAQSAAVACYNSWNSPTQGSSDIFFSDCMTDISFNYTNSGGYTNVGRGSHSPSSTLSYYNYSTIRRCNTFLNYVVDIDFNEESVKMDLLAQVRTIRAWRYFQMNFMYGGVPLIIDMPETASDAQLPRDSESKIKEFVYSELDLAIKDLNDKPNELGRIAKGTALAIKMRAALYWEDLDLALTAAKSIVNLGIYELDDNFQELFSIKGQNSKEIIYAMQHVSTTFAFGNMIRLYNNQDGGWASFVPTQNLVDMFEMENGLLITDAESGYDPTLPFYNRDPRLYSTVIYPGQDWIGADGKSRIINTLDKQIDGKSNADYIDAATNSSKTGMIWAKYTVPLSQYSASMDNDDTSPILFRYAEVLLTIAEIYIEKNENLGEALDIIDQLRTRGGQIEVDRQRYTTQKDLRELIRRERCIELAGEGLRRADLLRWKDDNGKMLAHSILNQTLYRMIGTINYSENDPTKRAVIEQPTEENKSLRKLDDKTFKEHHRYLPISQSEMDKNPKLEQNQGYN